MEYMDEIREMFQAKCEKHKLYEKNNYGVKAACYYVRESNVKSSIQESFTDTKEYMASLLKQRDTSRSSGEEAQL